MSRINTRSVLVILLVSGALGLAIVDRQYRPSFANLAEIGLAGYLAQLIPKKEEQ